MVVLLGHLCHLVLRFCAKIGFYSHFILDDGSRVEDFFVPFLVYFVSSKSLWEIFMGLLALCPLILELFDDHLLLKESTEDLIRTRKVDGHFEVKVSATAVFIVCPFSFYNFYDSVAF